MQCNEMQWNAMKCNATMATMATMQNQSNAQVINCNKTIIFFNQIILESCLLFESDIYESTTIKI